MFFTINGSAQIVDVFAGSSNSGNINSVGTSASFNTPMGICKDASGNFYVADYGNGAIRKITPTSSVSTLAGGSNGGYADGPGTTAKFTYPTGVCCDVNGNIFVADSGNRRIRKITPNGVVSTFAGNGSGAIVDGIGIAASFYSPGAICIDFQGNIFVTDHDYSDYNNQKIKIRKITPSGVVTTFAGSSWGYVDGIGTSAQFGAIGGICIDSSGNLIVADNTRIRKITATGVVSTMAGSTQGFTNGIGTSAQFGSLGGICFDTLGNIYVGDTYYGNIRKITPSLVVSNYVGICNGPQSVPSGFCIGTNNSIYIAGGSGHKILKTRDCTPNDAPIVTISPSIASICPGQSITLSASIGEESYLWNDGSITSSITVSPNVSTTYSVTVKGSCGCYTTINKTVTVNPIPTTTIIGQNSICYGQNTTLTASGGSSYLWSNGNTLSSITVNPSTTTTYSVTATNIYGCTSSASKTITVNSLPIISITPSNPISCSGQNITLTASGGTSYSWSNGAFGSSMIVAPTTNTAYSVTGTDANGCSATASKTINIYTTPATSISADGIVATSTTINNGSSVQLQLNGSLNALPNIQWTPSTAISSTTVSNSIVYPSSTTTYTASFINVYGCQQNTSFAVNVNPQPTIGTLSLTSPSSAAIGLFDTITVDVQLTGATNLYSLFMKLKGNAAVNQYLDYQGFTASTLLGSGSSVISTPPTVTNGVVDFGITKVGPSSGYSGSGLYYTLRFVPKNISIPNGTIFCFYIDDVSSYNSSGTQCGLNNQGQICFTFTNQVNVWPGDLNKSNSVSTADILPIGYFYNSTGPARPNATIQWNAQPATLWGYNHSSQNGDAYKVFADSNGDGVINNADQAALGFNMGQIHARHVNAKPFSITPNTQRNTLTVGELIVSPNATIINAATLPQTVTFTVNLNNTGGLYALYGISVNLIFDDTIFDLSTASVDYAGSIFGTAGSDCLVMNYNSATAVSVGLTRYANAAINGQGLLFKVTLQTKSPLGSSLTQTPVTAYVDSANNQVGETLVIQDAPITNLNIINNLGVNTVITDEFVLYPNPTNDILYLSTGRSLDQISNLKLIVFNTLGQIVNEMPIRYSNMQISTRNWGSSGVYFVKIVDDYYNILTTKKVILK